LPGHTVIELIIDELFTHVRTGGVADIVNIQQNFMHALKRIPRNLNLPNYRGFKIRIFWRQRFVLRSIFNFASRPSGPDRLHIDDDLFCRGGDGIAGESPIVFRRRRVPCVVHQSCHWGIDRQYRGWARGLKFQDIFVR
jgi:hypothetical protein